MLMNCILAWSKMVFRFCKIQHVSYNHIQHVDFEVMLVCHCKIRFGRTDKRRFCRKTLSKPLLIWGRSFILFLFFFRILLLRTTVVPELNLHKTKIKTFVNLTKECLDCQPSKTFVKLTKFDLNFTNVLSILQIMFLLILQKDLWVLQKILGRNLKHSFVNFPIATLFTTLI
jgi:hypothetical protein